MRRVTLRHRIHRGLGRLCKFVCIVRDRHTESHADWGYGGNGMVDLYCPNCLKLVRRVPLDDFRALDDLISAVEIAKANTPNT